MAEKNVYLDCAAAMPPDPEVLKFYHRELQNHYANQEAVHFLAYESRKVLSTAEKRLSAALTHSPDYRAIFAATATDLFRILSSFPEFPDVVSSKLEHPALTANLRNCCRKLTFLEPDKNGVLLPPDTGTGAQLLAIHHVQSELGVIQNLETVCASFSGICTLVDAVQSAGKLPFYPHADISIISGVKFGSPGGAAALLHPDGKFTEKLLKHADKCRHTDYSCGRIPAALISTLAFAAEQQAARMESDFSKITALNDLCRKECFSLGITPTIPENTAQSPYILHLMLPSQEAAVIVRALSASGVYIASGSACSAESDTPSPALMQLGFSKKAAYRALRISFGTHNCEEDVIFFISELKKALKNY